MSEITVLNKALLIVDAIRNELAMGTKHYSKRSGKLLLNAHDVAIAMKDSDLIIEPTESRRCLFGGK